VAERKTKAATAAAEQDAESKTPYVKPPEPKPRERDVGTAWFQNDRPTRAVNVSAAAEDVHQLCTKKGLEVSAIEPLADGGTRVVLKTMDGAETVRHAFKAKLLPRNAKRVPMRGHPSYG
jgi:hypothetical protein